MYAFFHNSIVIQLIGFIALSISFLVFQFNKRKKMLELQMLGNLLWTVHFFLLGAYTGSVLNFIGAGRSFAFNKYRNRKWSGFVLWGFIAVFSMATALTWQGLISLLPAFGMISGAFAYWQRAPKSIRLLALLSPPAWFTYNAISHSYAGMVTEVLIFASILLGMYRLDRPIRKNHASK